MSKKQMTVGVLSKLGPDGSNPFAAIIDHGVKVTQVCSWEVARWTPATAKRVVTNAKKGGSADYTVAVKKSKFYPVGDNSNDTWKDAKKQTAKLAGEEITGWVGFGDAADFIKFQVAQDGKVKLDLDKSTADALSGKKIKLSCLDKDGKAVAVALDKSNPSTLLSKKDVAAGEYYLGVSCANVKKYDDISYSIKTGLLAG